MQKGQKLHERDAVLKLGRGNKVEIKNKLTGQRIDNTDFYKTKASAGVVRAFGANKFF